MCPRVGSAQEGSQAAAVGVNAGREGNAHAHAARSCPVTGLSSAIFSPPQVVPPAAGPTSEPGSSEPRRQYGTRCSFSSSATMTSISCKISSCT